MIITSLQNAKVKQWMRYHHRSEREKDQCFLVEGEHLVQEAYKAGLVLYTIQKIGSPLLFPDCMVYEVSDAVLKKIRMCTSGANIMALCKYKPSSDSIGDKVIMLDGVQDPGNVGTIIRTALSFGYHSVILSDHSVDLYNEKLIRSTQGAFFHMNVLRMDIASMLLTLKQQQYHIYATSLQNAKPLSSISKMEKYVLIFGNEGKGIKDEILALSDTQVKIEMQTFESLNVAVAAGICMYYLQ